MYSLKPPPEQQAYLAKMLGYNPDAPETWPAELIERLFRLYHRAGSERLSEEVYKLVNRR